MSGRKGSCSPLMLLSFFSKIKSIVLSESREQEEGIAGSRKEEQGGGGVVWKRREQQSGGKLRTCRQC